MRAHSATVTFGPSRSFNMTRARTYARRYFGAVDIEEGRIQAKVALLDDRAPYLRLERLLAMVGQWPSTEVFVAEEIEFPPLVRSMAWCAADWIRARGYCAQTFPDAKPWPKCYTCPLLSNAQRNAGRAPDFPPKFTTESDWL